MNLYYKSLLSKKWKAKAKLILKRDGYKCTVCGSTDNLQVHHTYYYSNVFVPAYDYPNKSLITVCKGCHLDFHNTCETELRKKPKRKRCKKLKRFKRP